MNTTSATPEVKRVTTKAITAMKAEKVQVVCLTAYDYLTAKLVDQAGVDLILVGDSMAMVFQGQETTIPVTLEEMIYHAKWVVKGASRAMVVVDMPFMSYQTSTEEGFRNAGRIMKETNAGGVKVEGGELVADFVLKTTQAGIPVMGHVGLLPQSIHSYGGYQPRGTTDEEAGRILKDAKALEEAGAFSIVLENILSALAKRVSKSGRVPTIGIGAGDGCDGQILVVADMLGLYEDFKPRFVRRYAHLADEIRNAVQVYASDVRNRKFPSKEETY
jgi:3-methyl-2-oxobutanoate hydroxymethyltransferase